MSTAWHKAFNPADGKYGSRELDARELAVLDLLLKGLRNRQIAERLGSTEHSVKNMLVRIYDKTGMGNRVELALWYLGKQKQET